MDNTDEIKRNNGAYPLPQTILRPAMMSTEIGSISKALTTVPTVLPGTAFLPSSIKEMGKQLKLDGVPEPPVARDRVDRSKQYLFKERELEFASGQRLNPPHSTTALTNKRDKRPSLPTGQYMILNPDGTLGKGLDLSERINWYGEIVSARENRERAKEERERVLGNTASSATPRSTVSSTGRRTSKAGQTSPRTPRTRRRPPGVSALSLGKLGSHGLGSRPMTDRSARPSGVSVTSAGGKTDRSAPAQFLSTPRPEKATEKFDSPLQGDPALRPFTETPRPLTTPRLNHPVFKEALEEHPIETKPNQSGRAPSLSRENSQSRMSVLSEASRPQSQMTQRQGSVMSMAGMVRNGSQSALSVAGGTRRESGKMKKVELLPVTCRYDFFDSTTCPAEYVGSSNLPNERSLQCSDLDLRNVSSKDRKAVNYGSLRGHPNGLVVAKMARYMYLGSRYHEDTRLSLTQLQCGGLVYSPIKVDFGPNCVEGCLYSLPFQVMMMPGKNYRRSICIRQCPREMNVIIEKLGEAPDNPLVVQFHVLLFARRAGQNIAATITIEDGQYTHRVSVAGRTVTQTAYDKFEVSPQYSEDERTWRDYTLLTRHLPAEYIRPPRLLIDFKLPHMPHPLSTSRLLDAARNHEGPTDPSLDAYGSIAAADDPRRSHFPDEDE